MSKISTLKDANVSLSFHYFSSNIDAYIFDMLEHNLGKLIISHDRSM